MSDLARIDYSYRGAYAHRVVIALAEYRQLGRKGWFIKWGFFVCTAVAIVVEVFVVYLWFSTPNLPVYVYKFVLFGGLATIVAIFSAISLNCFVQRAIWRSVARDYGLRHASLSANGIAEKRGTFKSQCGWAGIVGAERMPQITLLLLGEGSAYVIPHDALPDGITIEALHDRIDQWRKAAS